MIIPIYMTFQEWANQLNIDYPSDIIPIVDDRYSSDWKEWAQVVVGSRSFSAAGAPDPIIYDTWEEWAMRVYEVMV